MTGHQAAIAVLDHSGAQRVLGGLLLDAASRCGLDLGVRSHRELVAEVDIGCAADGRPVVEPDRPLLWLSGADPMTPGDGEDGFLATETTAASRSIAALSSSPVLNRPSATSACGRFPASAVSSGRRLATTPELNPFVRAERFAGSIDVLRRSFEEEEEEVYDYAVGVASFGVRTEATGPFRSRTARRPGRLLRVRVVADRVIATRTVPPDVESASLLAAARYDLDLLGLWWLVAADGPATLARADCWLWDAALGADGAVLADALVQWVLAHLAMVSAVGSAP